jgi:hypothetical protein
MEPYKSSSGQGLGIAALILGIIALVLSFIPCIGLFAIIPGIVAIILSIVALSQANKINAPKGLVIAALVISILGTTIAILWTVFFANAIKKDGWLRTQIEKTIEDETGKTIDENWKDFGDDLEKKMEHLEIDSSSKIKIDIEIGDNKMTDEEFDKFIINYENLIKETIKLKKKGQNNGVKSSEALSEASVKLVKFVTKLTTSSSKLTKKQVKRIEELNKKYENELDILKPE